MSGPSATAKPMSAKIAVSSSTTWLIGWTRPASAGASRTGSVTSTVSVASRASSAAPLKLSRRGVQRGVDAVLEAVDRGPLHLALVRRHAAERLQQRRDRAALAERRDAHRLQRGLVGGRGDGCREFRFRARQCRSWQSCCPSCSVMPGHHASDAVDGCRAARHDAAVLRPPSASRQRRLGLLDDRLEGRRLGDGELGQHLAVDHDAGLGQRRR